MPVISDKDIMHGEPTLAGHRINVAHVVANVNESGLEHYVENFNISKKNVIEAIEYCKDEMCESAITYCQGCRKNKNYSGDELWKIAAETYSSL